MRNRKFHQRRGITLLFVVSMIVLFLLMGTTFVVVSNDYLRASKKRARIDIHSIDGPANLDRAFYDLIRGPELTNTTSPLRGQDLLSDQYGYGFKAFVNDAATPAYVSDSSNQFIEFVVAAKRTTDPSYNAAMDANMAFELLSPDAMMPNDLTAFDGIYNGLVISFVSGPLNGISTRINSYTIDSMTGNHYFTIPAMDWKDSIGSLNPATLVDSEIIVNGREFSGTGAGGFTGGALSMAALNPNRVGELLADLKNNYLDSSRSPNESYDAADFQNMFLAGKDSTGGLIMSFHRDGLPTMMAPGGMSNRGMFAALVDSAGEPIMVDTNNDSILDATWIDTGMPVQSNGEGLYYKRLVAYQVIDLDGRLNLNAHGNLAQVDPATNNYFIDSTSPVSALGGTVTNTLPRGSGMGPPEISLSGVFDNTQLSDLLASRYGGNGVPGDGGFVGKSHAKLFGYPFDIVDWENDRHGTVGDPVNGRPGLYASSPMDLHGRFSIVTPTNALVESGNAKDDFRDRNISAFPNAMPTIDMFESTWSGEEFSNSPYEMSFAPSPYNDSNDEPFDLLELEKVLRSSDVDSNLLPRRLWEIPGTDDNARRMFWAANRDLVTTDSFEIPTTYDSLLARLIAKLGLDPNDPGPINRRLDRLSNQKALAPNLLNGLKFDVNRPFGNGYDDDGDFVVDDPGEAADEFNRDQGGIAMDLNNDGIVNNPEDIEARADFARQLYVLMLLVCDRVDVDLDGDGMADPDGFEKALAQWAVNVVDFRDPDSIMTRFEYDPDPFDAFGWNPLRNQVVFGCERPELLLTETFAAHVRRTEDLDTDPSGDDTVNSDEDYDQRLRPEAFAFIELYNPWTQNSLNQQLDASLYDTVDQGVDLSRLSAGGSPVWRISVERPDRGEPLPDQNTTPLRYVYFADPDSSGSDTVGDEDAADVEVFFTSYGVDALRPGGHALVGSLGIEDPNNAGRFRSFLGRRNTKTEADELADNLELDMTQHIAIDPSNGEVTRFPVDPETDPRYAVIVPVDTFRPGSPAGGPTATRSFNVSDPFGGYPDADVMGMPTSPVPDGEKYETPWDVPLDHPTRTDENRNAEDIVDILTDDGMAQQFRIVRLQRLANPLEPWDERNNPYVTIDSMEMDLVALNGVTTGAVPDPMLPTGLTPPNAIDAAIGLERGEQNKSLAVELRRQLWGAGRGPIPAGTPGAGDHYFDVELVESLGKTNDAYSDAAIGDIGFPWLTWNNRPYVSHLELANVPYVAPDRLTSAFSIDNNNIDNPYAPTPMDMNTPAISGRFRHLLNFFADEDLASSDQPNLYKVMDYLEVPSRFLGVDRALTPTDLARNPFNYLSRYRVPGKINLNTIYDEEIWNGLLNDVAENNYASMAGCTWDDFQDSRRGTSSKTDFENPFRPAGTGGYVPPNVTAAGGVECTLFRTDGATGEPLFDFESDLMVAPENAANDTNRSAYFRNAMRQRLGNLVTTRSSVFAIWITVGYFEVDQTGALVDANNGGKEIGVETGEVKRNRGFYIYDRSIPVAFEPGQNHNVERGILVKTIIE